MPQVINTSFRPFPTLPVRALALFSRHLLAKLQQALKGLYGPVPEPLESAIREAAIAVSALVSELAIELSPEDSAYIERASDDGKGNPERRSSRRSELAGLTSRERQVLRLICSGYHNQQIAKRLNYGLGTIKADVRAILEKLGASDRTQAVAVAIKKGLM